MSSDDNDPEDRLRRRIYEQADEINALLKSLDHATTCPLTRSARIVIGGGDPSKIAVCDGCRDALLLLKKAKLLT